MTFHFHKWGKWEDAAYFTMKGREEGKTPVTVYGPVAKQTRHCSVCNKAQMRYT